MPVWFGTFMLKILKGPLSIMYWTHPSNPSEDVFLSVFRGDTDPSWAGTQDLFLAAFSHSRQNGFHGHGRSVLCPPTALSVTPRACDSFEGGHFAVPVPTQNQAREWTSEVPVGGRWMWPFTLSRGKNKIHHLVSGFGWMVSEEWSQPARPRQLCFLSVEEIGVLIGIKYPDTMTWNACCFLSCGH